MSTDKYPEFRQILNERYPHCCFRHEYKGLKPRQYAFDIALVCCKIAIEIEGGAGFGPGHRNVGNFHSDMEKYNLAQAEGWRVFRTTPKETRRKNLTNSKILCILDRYFQLHPCNHSELNKSLRVLFT